MNELINNNQHKFSLCRCKIYHPFIEGKTDETLYSQFIKICQVNIKTFYKSKKIYKNFIKKYKKTLIHFYFKNKYDKIPHPVVRNYTNILFNHRSFQIEICQTIPITDSEGYIVLCVIIKTFWLKIIQRRWKNIFKLRKHIIKSRCSIPSQKYFEIHGIYPQDCFRLPGIVGMLKDM
jgi:hypothetical protein